MITITRASRQRFSRRAVLRRLGASAAFLPLLSSRWASAAAFPKRLITITWNNGVPRPFFYPPGDDPTASRVLTPLVPFKSKVTLLAALDIRHMLDGGHKYDGHFSFPAIFTGTYKNLGGQSAGATGPSIDHVVSAAIAKTVNLPRPLLAVAVAGNSTSYNDTGARNTAETDAGRLFSGLFSNMAAPPAQISAIRTRRKSILDYVKGDLTAFAARLGTDDRVKVTNPLESVRKLELELSATASSGNQCMPTAPGAAGDYQAKMKAFNDLTAMAVRCDVTRTVSLTWAANGGSSPSSLPFLNYGSVAGGGIGELHTLAHMGAAGHEGKSVVDTWFVSQVAYLAKALDAVVEANGKTALDNSVLVVGNDMSENHDVSGIGYILLGSAGGALKTGTVVRLGKYAGKTGNYWMGDSGVPNNHLLATIAQAMDVPMTDFGTGYPGNLHTTLLA